MRRKVEPLVWGTGERCAGNLNVGVSGFAETFRMLHASRSEAARWGKARDLGFADLGFRQPLLGVHQPTSVGYRG
jgi:hypothetical protein